MAKKTTPSGLPEIERDPPAHERSAALKPTAHTCSKCGNDARIVSNQYGVNAHCGVCKTHWPISSMPMAEVAVPIGPRGLRKKTTVEPDWNKAYEDD